ncbi:32 kDa beta-galactoside-binding lectin-like [Dendropsophus ebraccatus]|uniref:32 kDa beta-galactoside-binding lectin-like n=1 Tax=Dendropsophus ebraccatus TaxID=150705 RepID=UPI003832299F
MINIIRIPAAMTFYKPESYFRAAFRANFLDKENETVTLMGQIYTADKFAVNLINSKTGNIHFNFNCSVYYETIAGNSREGGYWGNEVIGYPTGKFPFKANTEFTMEIKNVGSTIEVYVHGERCMEFLHRLPFNEIDYIEITGEVDIRFIKF